MPASIVIRIPSPLRAACGGAELLSTEAATMRAALLDLSARHPELYRSVCDETGSVRRHIGLFVNESHVRDRAGLDTALEPGDVVSIFPAVSGG